MKEFKSFYKTVDGNEGQKCHYPTRLDTYGCGCFHDCKYCYAKSLLEFRDLWDADEPRVADIGKIEKKIKTIPKGSVLRLGGMTDCFQPCEKTCRVTYKTIQLLNKYGIHYLIVTKSDMIADKEYIDVLDKNLAHIQITVTSTDDKIALSYERATLSSKRIAAIEKLEAEGFDVQIRLSPFIPEYLDLDVVANIKCRRAIVEFLRVNTFIKKTFTNLNYDAYTHKEGGYYHLPLSTKKAYVSKIAQHKEVSICEDCSEAYEYWQNHVNTFPDDCCNLRFSDHKRFMGNIDLLKLNKTAFLCSSTNDKAVISAASNWASTIDTNSTCVISGFQSPAEREVLDRLLQIGANVVVVLAKKLPSSYPTKFKEALKQGRLLLISPFYDFDDIVTKTDAQRRNEYVLNHSQQAIIGTITQGGMLDNILKQSNTPYKILV